MGLYDLSKTAASNTTIEGVTAPVGAMPPSNVGPMFRAMAAMLKKYQEDTGGAVTTGGSANAQTLNLNSDPYSGALTFADGDPVTFIAGFTNTDAATLNVEGEGAKSIRKGNDQALVGGEIIAGAVYSAYYDASANSAAGGWILLGQPYDANLNDIAARSAFNTNLSTITIADDAATTITFTISTFASGFLFISPTAAARAGGMFWFRVGTSPASNLVNTGLSGTEAGGTGALTGTTGTDGNLTVTGHTDGKLYIENRTGFSANYEVSILALTPTASVASIP